jgi:uncharacterized membrane protein YbaN (DUF454 family)
VRRALLVSLGILLVGVGFAGAFLPLVPTTFPLILAAGLFARSSERFHRWLLGHRVFGAYIRNYQEGRGMTIRHKVLTVATLWGGIGVSMYYSRASVVAIIVLSVILVGVTIHVLVLPTADSDQVNGRNNHRRRMHE